ncbi:TetR/AcrR family transcriptional regulator [Scopulibacillus cellulosilyticus]|uniref:TetR/AcrR family transcriptional regulator n=1 Tax=Scopulibacillus cellulosilyticus TaxID=2665665 RepID=A0ABW2PU49_9BACL
MENGNVQNILVKECIFEAFMILLANKNFNDISITEITNKAGVSRMAYYRNYSSKEEIIHDHLNELILHFLNEFENKDSVTPYQKAKTFFCFFRHHKILLDNLIKSNVTYILLEHLEKNIHPLLQASSLELAKNTVEAKYKAHFIAGGLFQILIEWCKNNMLESDDQMAQLTMDFILVKH